MRDLREQIFKDVDMMRLEQNSMTTIGDQTNIRRRNLIWMIANLVQEVENIDGERYIDQTEDLNALRDLSWEWDNCEACALCKNRGARLFDSHYDRTQFCGVAFIGEGPGKTEKQNGIPFSGEAGSILDRILDLLGLERDQVYVTNAVVIVRISVR